MRLFRTILALMLLASAVPTAVLGWLLASTSSDQLVTDALELAGERVERLRLQASSWLGEAGRAVEDVARGSAWAGAGLGERQRLLASLLERRADVSIVTVYGADGRKVPHLQAFPGGVAPSEIAEHELAAAALLPLLLAAPAGDSPRLWSPVHLARGGAALTLVVVGAMLGLLWRRERRRSGEP